MTKNDRNKRKLLKLWVLVSSIGKGSHCQIRDLGLDTATSKRSQLAFLRDHKVQSSWRGHHKFKILKPMTSSLASLQVLGLRSTECLCNITPSKKKRKEDTAESVFFSPCPLFYIFCPHSFHGLNRVLD